MNMQCQVRKDGDDFQVTLVLKMDDKMNRQLQARFQDAETSEDLADELVQYGFINVNDRDMVVQLLNESRKQSATASPVELRVTQVAA